MTRYVQHISGQGEKWEVCAEYELAWSSAQDRNHVYFLPKSEYIICVPPEEWEDVTTQVDYCGSLAFAHRNGGELGDEVVTDDKGYRFRKIDGLHHGPAFVVERKKT